MGRRTLALRNLALNAQKPEYDNGYIRVYSGTRPTDASTALSGNTLLAELRFGATAFPTTSTGVLTANSITADSSADATGTASFVRCLKADGTTALIDLSVGVGSGEVQFATLSFVAAALVTLSSLTITDPLGT